MCKSLLILAAVAAVCSAQGPTAPMVRNVVCLEEGYMMVDNENMCWYHECTLGENGLTMLPRRCALGSKVSYNFIDGKQNPCTINFDDVLGYTCQRAQPSVDGPPACYNTNRRMQCQNGGSAVYEADKCWCDCPPEWRGDFLCNLPTMPVTNIAPGSNICVGGQPQADWCALEGNRCSGRGDCYNQCDTFWCDCQGHNNNDYYGKRCELQRDGRQ